MLKIGLEESVLLFWESVVVGHLGDSFVLTESFVNRPCLVQTHSIDNRSGQWMAPSIPKPRLKKQKMNAGFPDQIFLRFGLASDPCPPAWRTVYPTRYHAISCSCMRTLFIYVSCPRARTVFQTFFVLHRTKCKQMHFQQGYANFFRHTQNEM